MLISCASFDIAGIKRTVNTTEIAVAKDPKSFPNPQGGGDGKTSSPNPEHIELLTQPEPTLSTNASAVGPLIDNNNV